ncbi:hypothetical protein RA274_28055, partial [Pseudomonas syringae pv. tagetis]|uniref:hypothetical protein n=1 Tax=Pseudomonas syringae group genomosp. 7 TaxID=251699 RepID=UPI00376FEB03
CQAPNCNNMLQDWSVLDRFSAHKFPPIVTPFWLNNAFSPTNPHIGKMMTPLAGRQNVNG